ncbi:hypothetical protein [Burkholderia mayonis]|uniref:hypothetical protein n=1 Tax=Burkholderia mayonis TaxID=1385591 RepID=UPI00131F2C48
MVKAGRAPEELAREFEPTAQTIHNWVAQADRDGGKRHDGLTTAKREHEILSKSAPRSPEFLDEPFFACPPPGRAAG